MSKGKLYDVIVAGAGPVGILLACELGLAGASVLVLESYPDLESPWKGWPLGLRGMNSLTVEALYRRGLMDKVSAIDKGAWGKAAAERFDGKLDKKDEKMAGQDEKTGIEQTEKIWKLDEKTAKLEDKWDERWAKPAEKWGKPKEKTGKPRPQFGNGNFAGHFAAIMLESSKLDLDRWKYRLEGPALRGKPTTVEAFEKALSERAESLGVTILRGAGVTKIAKEDENSITIEAGESQSFSARWLVGADGGRSFVRKAAGFEFLGTEPKYTNYSSKCDVDFPEKLVPGFHITDKGMYIYLPPNGLHVMDFDRPDFDRKQEITLEHLQEAFHRVRGASDVSITKVHLVSSNTDRCKQASTYRKGRVLLAGDSAHINSPIGAQGMNLGLGDAMNLGWKLAATVKQESKSDGKPVDLGLLDTYEAERHAIATWVLEWTRAQVTTLQPNPYGRAMRKVVEDLIATKDGTNLMIGRVWGFAQRYQLGDTEAHSHELIGTSHPDFEFNDGSRLGPKFENGKGCLVNFTNNAALKDLAEDEKYASRVNYIDMAAKNTCGLGALLIRPDGIVAWLSEEKDEPDLSAAKAAFDQWFAL